MNSALLLLLGLALQNPPGSFDPGKPASPPDKLYSVGVRGSVDAGGYAASATARSQSDLFNELAAAQSTVVATLHSCAANSALQQEADGQLDAAVAAFETLDPFAEGVALLLAGNLARASQIFATRRMPPELSLLGQGSSTFQAGDVNGALNLFVEAATVQNPVLDGYRFVTLALQTANLTPALLDSLTGESATAHLARATALTRLERNPQAKRELQAALRKNPQLTEAHLQLGALLAKDGDIKSAVAEYEFALRLRPNLVEAHYRLGQLYGRSGNTDGAKAELAAHSRLRQQQRSDIEAGRVPVRISPTACAQLNTAAPTHPLPDSTGQSHPPH